MSKKATSLSRFWHPRHWGTWVMLGAFRLVPLLPYRWLLAMSAPAGYLLRKLWKAREPIARKNITVCFPELDQQEQKKLLIAHFRSVAMGFFEIALAWWSSDKQLRAMAKIEGKEHLDAAQASGRGVILLSAHFTCVELSLRLLSLSSRVDLVYRRAKLPLVDAVMYRARDNHVSGELIDKTDMRRIIRRLKDAATICFLPDQAARTGNRADAPFFGVLAATNIAFERLARMTNAEILPILVVRNEDKNTPEHYSIRFFPAMDELPDDPQEIANTMNALFESWIRTVPEQYFWLHRRFKDIPGFYD